jgi:hypothetical protein
MEEARASWNTIYQDAEGFECQLTLRDDDEESLAARVAAITSRIVEAGGAPVVRRFSNGQAPAPNDDAEEPSGSEERPPEKTYIDSKGVRRCNLKLKNGRICRQPVTEKEGRYGLFWSCPSYRDHAPQPRG